MQYVAFDQPGGPEVLQLVEGDAPRAGAGELLIQVAAAGVNRPDIAQRYGLYPPPPGASAILGLEVAGVVADVGRGVSGWQPGDTVCALTNGGGYAQYAVAPSGQCLPVPDGLSMVEAAALPETFFTVWTNVFDRGRLQPGESLLVHGGSSGIGVAAIQMAAAHGARVFVTAGSASKCEACIALGAEVAVNYREHDFVAVLRDATGGQGVDVILDMVGGDYVGRNLQLAATGGRIVNIAFQAGFESTVNFLPLLINRLTITGSTLRPQSAEVKASIADALRSSVWPRLVSGEIRPVIYREFPLADAGSAHHLMESNEHIGKIVLSMPEGAG